MIWTPPKTVATTRKRKRAERLLGLGERARAAHAHHTQAARAFTRVRLDLVRLFHAVRVHERAL